MTASIRSRFTIPTHENRSRTLMKFTFPPILGSMREMIELETHQFWSIEP